MVTTRSQILSFLEKRGQASAIEISRALKLTPANIRHHLKMLQNEGVVVSVQLDRATGRGRPAYLYALSAQQKAHNLERLCMSLLEYIRTTKSEDETTTFLRFIAQQLVSGHLTAPKRSLTTRLIFTMKILNEMSYRASWEAHREAPTIKFSHCPYATLVDAFPELCQMDKYLLETLMECPIEVISIRQSTPSGEINCHFRLRQPIQ